VRRVDKASLIAQPWHGETTAELLDACCRLWTCERSEGYSFLSGLIQREIIYRILRGAEGTGCERLQRWATRATGRPKRLRGSGQLCEAAACGRSAQTAAWACRRCIIISDAYVDESSSVSEAASVAGGSGTHC